MVGSFKQITSRFAFLSSNQYKDIAAPISFFNVRLYKMHERFYNRLIPDLSDKSIISPTFTFKEWLV